MKSIRRCEIVSNLKRGEETLFDMENMKRVLEERSHCIESYSYVIHDKDRYTKDDEIRNQSNKVGELKQPHIHLLLKFKKEQPQKLEYVAKWFGIKENFINLIKGKWEDACLYQIHANKSAANKYQYPIEAVTCNFDLQTLLNEHEKKNQINIVLERILSGEIREYNKTLEIDNLMLVMNSRIINEAFKVRSEHLQATVKDRNMKCIFITGGSSVGKTTLAKMIAKEKGLDFFVSSGSNDVLDGYAQEPCVILDDLRPSVLGLSDILKMLDNHTASSVKSRYKNKFLNCDLIILTTVLDIDTFYSNVFSEHDEPIVQLKRRCGTYIRVTKDAIFVSVWDDNKMRYTKPIMYENNILEIYIHQNEAENIDVQKNIKDLIPFLELKKENGFCLVNGIEQLSIPFEEKEKLHERE